jgi:hypothetical protein
MSQGIVAYVETGEIAFDDEDTVWSDDGGGVYADYLMSNRYVDDPNTYMMAIASPAGFNGQQAAFVQLAAPTLTVACDWTACHTDSPPVIPDTTPADSNWVFLGKTPETVMPGVAVDGKTPIYRIKGTYFYGYKGPWTESLVVAVFPRPPWQQDVYQRTIPTSARDTSLTLTGGTAGGGSAPARYQTLRIGFVTTQ